MAELPLSCDALVLTPGEHLELLASGSAMAVALDRDSRTHQPREMSPWPCWDGEAQFEAIADLAPTLFREGVPSAPLLREAQRSAVLITRDQRFVRKLASVPEAAALVRVLASDDNGSDRSSAHNKRPSQGPARLRPVSPSP